MKIVIKYYAVVIMILFSVYNIVLKSLKIYGSLYQGIMLLWLVLNSILLFVFRKNIRYKEVVIILLFFMVLFSKDMLQGLFSLFTIFLLMVIGFRESRLIKILSILCIFLFVKFPLFILGIFIFSLGLDLKAVYELDDIYEDMHYYCENHYEVYTFSAGAMDRFHYSIGKYYEILSVDDIITISYNERHEKTQKEYVEFLESHTCYLVGDANGFK